MTEVEYESWKRSISEGMTEDVRESLRNQKIGMGNPNYGKDITNSLSEESNRLRIERARDGVRRYYEENPWWKKYDTSSPQYILWSMAPEILEDSRGSTTISKCLVGSSKFFNTVLKIKTVYATSSPREDVRWCAEFRKNR
jgi:hypothetical protein